MEPIHRILLLDAYDSFSNNLASLIRNITHAEVHTIKIDTYTFSEFRPFLASFDAVVIGPGPGSPETPEDVGIIPYIWSLPEEEMIPVFGVCLGFQSLCLAFGGNISKLKVVKHGLSSVIRHSGEGLFEGCGTVDAIRYHSLRAELSKQEAKDLEVLAVADDGADENGDVIMAVRHKTRPFWAVQYHPESCCTNAGGAKVVQNWWRMATDWLRERNRRSTHVLSPMWKIPLRQRSLQGSQVTSCVGDVKFNSFYAPCLSVVRICEILRVEDMSEFAMLESSAKHTGQYTIIGAYTHATTETITYKVDEQTVSVATYGLQKDAIVDEPINHLENGVWEKLALYMSANRAKGGDVECPFWGGFIGYFNYEIGVAGLDIPLKRPRTDESKRVVSKPDVNLTFFHRSIVVDNFSGKIWVQSILNEDGDWISDISERIQLAAAMSITPVATPPLNGNISQHSQNGPSLHPQPQENTLNCGSPKSGNKSNINSLPFPPSAVKITPPNKEIYISNVRKCQVQLSLGESYELCLTAQTIVDVDLPYSTTQDSGENTAWKLYRRLRTKNPAPFAGYLRSAGTTLLSSSPERFLSWDRNGKFQLRPIKGTVRKAKVDGSVVSRKEAEVILNTPKERAENLMIVDLIRHDLHGVLDWQENEDNGNPVDRVKVEKLMRVEEYETVFQLVSVIEGTMGRNMKEKGGFTGLDVLCRSLPPGSMTGAPKKRSVEILQEIEREANQGNNCGERAVYSGVLGYWSVCGAGDWSVVIRSMFRFDDEFLDENVERQKNGLGKKERWRIGAGGAVTALSDPEGEWEEMLTKLNSSLCVFG